MTLRPSILLILLISSTCAAAYAPASKAQISDAETSGLQTVGPLPLTYPDAQAAIADLEQELTELKQAVAQGSADAQQEELGDVLFSAANVSRFLDCDAEEALDAATVKFVRRFREMERLAAQQGCAVDDLSAAELDKLWKRAKEVFTKR